MAPKGVYFCILIGFSVISFATASGKYNYISDCIIHECPLTINDRVDDNVTLICGESENLNLFITHQDKPKTIRCPNYAREIFVFWPGVWNFKDCNLPKFERGFFKGFSYMHRLDISDIGLEELEAEMVQNATDLKYFIAKENRLTEIPTQLFAGVEKLLYIDFSYNKIKQIDPLTFADLKKLEFLNLSRNEITSLDEQVFSDTANLTTLDLSHNKLTHLQDYIFDNLFKLKHLILSHNYLKNLPTSKKNQFSELELFDLRHNAFECSFLESILTTSEVIKAEVLTDAKFTVGNNNTREITCTNQLVNVTERSAIPSELQTEAPRAPVTEADEPLKFNLHGIISESHKEAGDNIVVTTTFEFPKKFFSKLFGLL